MLVYLLQGLPLILRRISVKKRTPCAPLVARSWASIILAVSINVGCAAPLILAVETSIDKVPAERAITVKTNGRQSSQRTRAQASDLRHKQTHEAFDAVVYVKARSVALSGSSGEGSRASKISTCFGGGGVILSRDGIILTCEHVVQGADAVDVILADGRVHRASQVLAHPALDLAILKIETAELTPIAFCNAGVFVGSDVYALTRKRDSLTVDSRMGDVTRVQASLQDDLVPPSSRDYRDLIESSANVELGFSGGPLVNTRGELVGLNVAARGEPTGIADYSYAIPWNESTARALLQLLSRLEPAAEATVHVD